MNDPTAQCEREYQHQEDLAAAREVRVDQATEEAMRNLSAVELYNCLTEVDVSQVEQGTFKAGSAEDLFFDLLTAIHLANSPGGEGAVMIIGNRVKDLVYKNHRDHEIDIITE